MACPCSFHMGEAGYLSANMYKVDLSYEVASGSAITPCNKIDKPLVVYRFTYLSPFYGNVPAMTTLHTVDANGSSMHIK